MVPADAAQRAAPAPRAPFAFGSRFYLALMIGLVWLGPAWWDRQFLWGMVAWDAALVLFWLLDFRQLPRPAEIELRRHWREVAALGESAEVEIELINHGTTLIQATVVDDAPATFRKEPPVCQIAAPARGSGRAAYQIRPLARGDASVGGAFIRYQGPARMAERWARADLSQVVRVYPSLEEARKHTIYLIRSRQVELEKRLNRQRGRGHEFESLREFRDGDELRDICWTATARRGTPITRVYQIERSQPVWLCLDAGRLLRARTGELTKLDHAVNAALKIGRAHV